MSFNLEVSRDNHYFLLDGKPFFWLGDTAWLLFHKLTDEEAFFYLDDRARKGFNVVQASLVHYVGKNQRYDVHDEAYWRHIGGVVDYAAEKGIFMALLPAWGSLVKGGTLNESNVETYARFLNERFSGKKNIIWLLGGDIKPEGLEQLYDTFASLLRQAAPKRLIGFHPFGRCSSSLWFDKAPWLDFNMFQSGHRRYDQCQMGAWDDTSNIMSLFGEDNWRYVQHDLESSDRPVIDGEPSYEGIPQGLHDPTQPRWTAKDVRRYAYWSVLAGAAGHTYGDNAIMQFFDGGPDTVGAYGCRENWKTALNHPGAGQMRILKAALEKVDFTRGRARDAAVIGGQRERHERIAAFEGPDFLFCYSFTGNEFTLDTSAHIGKTASVIDPATGETTLSQPITAPLTAFRPTTSEGDALVTIR